MVPESATTKIILYDSPPHRKPSVKSQPWSPNTWKVRYALNIKGLSYETVWVELPDVASLCLEIGAKPTYPPGSPFEYSVPVIKDTATGVVVSDSFDIVRYLDETYTDTPQLLVPNILSLQLATSLAMSTLILKDAIPCLALPTNNILSPRAQIHFRATRERMLGTSFEAISPADDVALEQQWGRLEAAFAQFAQYLDAVPGPFFLGEQVSFSDVHIMSYLMWARASIDDDRWKKIMGWSEGRWERLAKEFENWQAVDIGSNYKCDAKQAEQQ